MNCWDCGEPIQFLEGDRRPYDLTPRVHYANPKHIAAKRNGQVSRQLGPKKGKLTEAETMGAEVVGWLRDGGYTRDDAVKWVKAAGEAKDPEALYLAALLQRGKEIM